MDIFLYSDETIIPFFVRDIINWNQWINLENCKKWGVLLAVPKSGHEGAILLIVIDVEIIG